MVQYLIQSHFDEEAKNYPSDFKTSHTQFMKWKLIKDHILPNSRCLDIGAANGRHIIPMSKYLNVDGVALDLSPSMLTTAKSNAIAQNTMLQYVVSRGERLPFSDASFDATICYSTMLFMEDDNKCLIEMSRVLRSGGKIIIDVHGRFNFGIYYWQRYYKKHGIEKLISHSLSASLEMISNAGLDTIQCYPTGVWMQVGLLPIIGNSLSKLGKNKKQAVKKDFDARLSERFPSLANRWFIVAKKP